MSVNYSPFISTKQMFVEYLTGYSFPISFETWLASDEEEKAALLFVNFYDQIVLAFSRSNAAYVLSEDAVSTILMVLTKNATILQTVENGEKRFTPNYFYTVAWGAFYSLVRSIANKSRDEHEICNEIENSDSDVSINLFDFAPSHDDTCEMRQAKEAVWDIIAHMGPKAEKVVNHLINPKDTLHKISKSSSEYDSDRLADVSVTPSEYESILAALKIQLAPYAEFFC